MRDWQTLLQTAKQILVSGDPGLFATLIGTEGSSYRPLGSILIASHGHSRAGGVSGGCLEDYVVREGLDLTRNGTAALLDFETTHDPEQTRPSPGCGGRLFVLVEPLAQSHVDLLQFIVDNAEQGLSSAPWRQVVLCGTSLTITFGLTGQHSTKSVIAKSSLQWRGGESSGKVYGVCRYIPPPLRLIILGAGDDIPALVRQAKLLNWHTTVADRRLRLVTVNRFPEADLLLADSWGKIVQSIIPTDRTAILLMTHSLVDDIELLPLVLPLPVPFLGMLGPPARRAAVLTEIESRILPSGNSLNPDDLARLSSPVGLDLGEKSPESIALSICAQITAVLSGKVVSNGKHR